VSKELCHSLSEPEGAHAVTDAAVDTGYNFTYADPYYDYAPGVSIGIGPVGIGVGPAWGW
jgi:hypothetical protein